VNWYHFSIFLTILVADQLTKLLALAYLSQGATVEIIPGFFNLTLVYNPGAAFGIFATLPDTSRRIVLGVVTVIAVIVIFRLASNEAKDRPILQGALSSILAGAIGNLIDRLRFDAVVDFLDFYVGTYHWPAFNIADSAISVGVAIVFLGLLRTPSPELDDTKNREGK